MELGGEVGARHLGDYRLLESIPVFTKRLARGAIVRHDGNGYISGRIMGKKKPRIRPLAICLLRQGDRLLLHEGVDAVRGIRFGRPLGGGIDFGETSRDAAIREIREELGAEITDVELLGILESIYVYEEKPGHEIVFVYSGRFVDESLYERESLTVTEGKRVFEAHWRSLEELRSGEILLVPEDLWQLL